MRIALLVLVVAAVALLALPSSPTSPVAPGLAFAAEVSSLTPIPIDSACNLYCNENANGKYCGPTPSGQNGCDHINALGNCIYTLCPPCPNPPCGPIGPRERAPDDPPASP
jgi:hypothetical protein